jgi:hypothetical protein
MQDDVAGGQYAQSSLGVADENLEFTSPVTLSFFKKHFVILQQRR